MYVASAMLETEMEAKYGGSFIFPADGNGLEMDKARVYMMFSLINIFSGC